MVCQTHFYIDLALNNLIINFLCNNKKGEFLLPVFTSLACIHNSGCVRDTNILILKVHSAINCPKESKNNVLNTFCVMRV